MLRLLSVACITAPLWAATASSVPTFSKGPSEVVLNVPRYDFNWQLAYKLAEPLALPKGARLECVAHFDNSANNKFNPDPSKEVKWGPQTWEEMMIGWFDYTSDRGL